MDVHRVRFIEYDPQPIHCLAFSDESSKSPELALSRSDGSIEIWRTSNGENFYKDIWVPGRTDGSVEALAWCRGRLFTSGLTGIIVEWDLAHLRPSQSQDSFGGAVWCMQPDRIGALLAVGSEDGQVRLFDVTSDNLSFTRGLDRQGGRVLSLAWHPDGGSIVAGGADSIIRKLDTKSGRCVLRITLEKQQSHSTLVWDLRVLSDSTIVSADSLGKVQLWSSSHGTLIQSHQLHTADVLTLAVSDDETKIYSSGIDQKVVRLQRVENKCNKWLKSGQIRAHSHDVRAVSLSSSGILASAGVDTQLVTCPTSSFENNDCNKHHPCPDSSHFFSVARRANVLVHQSSMALKFWQLSVCHQLKSNAVPTAAASTSIPNGDRQLKADACSSGSKAGSPSISLPHCTNGVPTNFLEIKCSGPSHILSSAVSPDAVHVALSTVDNLWLYQIDHKKLNIKCTKQTPLPSFKMTFSPDGQFLVLATIDEGVKCIDAFTLDIDNARTVQTSSKNKRLIVDFDISPDGKLIAVLNYNKRLAVLDLKSGNVLCKVPRMESAPTLFKFHPSCVELVLFTGTERQLCTYSIVERHLNIIGSVGLHRLNDGRSKLSCPNGLVALPDKDTFVVYDTDSVAVVRTTVQSDSSSNEKPSSRKRKRRSFEGGTLRYQFIAAQPLVLYVSLFGERELVIAELSWAKVLDKLPPALVRDQYGT